jgi:DNA polymerase-3 subunit beta
MKLNAKAGSLADALALAHTLVEKPDKMTKTIVALGAVRIGATINNSAELSVNTLDFAIAVRTDDMEIIEPGEAAVSLSALSDLIDGFASDISLAINTSDKSLTVVGDRGRFRLPTIPLADLPIMLAIDQEIGRLDLPTTDFLQLLKPVSVAATEATRYYMCGVLLHTVGDELIGVATDGHRLLRVAVPAAEFSASRDLIVSYKAVHVVSKLLKATKPGTVTLRRSKTLLAIQTDQFDFSTKLIDADYPAYERLVPDTSDHTVIVDRAALIAALARLDAVATKGKTATLAALRWEPGPGVGGLSAGAARRCFRSNQRRNHRPCAVCLSARSTHRAD